MKKSSLGSIIFLLIAIIIVVVAFWVTMQKQSIQQSAFPPSASLPQTPDHPDFVPAVVHAKTVR